MNEVAGVKQNEHFENMGRVTRMDKVCNGGARRKVEVR